VLAEHLEVDALRVEHVRRVRAGAALRAAAVRRLRRRVERHAHHPLPRVDREGRVRAAGLVAAARKPRVGVDRPEVRAAAQAVGGARDVERLVLPLVGVDRSLHRPSRCLV